MFTAGIGENSPVFRKVITDRLSALGIVLDEEKIMFVKRCFNYKTRIKN